MKRGSVAFFKRDRYTIGVVLYKTISFLCNDIETTLELESKFIKKGFELETRGLLSKYDKWLVTVCKQI